MAAPTVELEDFKEFSGKNLTTDEGARVEVMLNRATRRIARYVPDDTDWTLATADYTDAVCELAWFFWEAERAGVIEILALPLSQLSLGTLFWTKSSTANMTGLRSRELGAVAHFLDAWGEGAEGIKFRRVILDGELPSAVA
jgi:hypothetical protein